MSKQYKNLFVVASLFATGIIPTTLAFAQAEGRVVISADSLEKHKSIWLFQNWKYHPGDNPDWASPEFDDVSWETKNTRFPPNQLPGDWNGIGWFRLRLAVDSTLWNRPLALSLWLWGAAEIYLDGRPIAQYGKVGLSMNDEQGYFANPELDIPRSIVFDNKTNHVLAVRYSSFYIIENVPNIWHGFRITLRDLNSAVATNAEQRNLNANILMMMTAVPVVFAVLHLLLFLFYRRAKENLYYAIFTLTIGAGAFFSANFEFSFITNLRQGLLFKNLAQIFVLLMALSGLRFLYAIFYPRLPKQFWLFLVAYIAVVTWLWGMPFHTEDYANWFAIIINLEAIRVVATAILKKKEGAWIIGTGFTFMAIAFGLPVILTGMGILPWNRLFTITVPFIGITGLLLSMSILLARNFARTNRDLESQLVQVKELSEKTLQQEIERVKLKQELELEHLQAEKFQEIDRVKSHFFANISHEFRTPLTLILGPLQKLLSEHAEESVKKQFRIMLRNGRRLLRLINQLLDLSKLEAGKMMLKAKPENIVQILKGIVLSFSSLAERKQISLTFDAPEESIIVFVDRDKLEKIVTNLLSNAFKFTQEGGSVAVAVGSSTQSDFGFVSSDSGMKEKSTIRNSQSEIAREYIEIKVKDTGAGIPAEKLLHVFDRFYQVDNSNTREQAPLDRESAEGRELYDYAFPTGQEGSGIGLALTKELVELHHGEIKVSSKPGAGSTFIVRLPMGKDHLQENEIITETTEHVSEISQPGQAFDPEPGSEAIAEPAAKIHHTDDTKGVPQLLIVEDNADVRTYIRECLDKKYQILEAPDGEEGFERAAEVVPDLIVSDVMMPKIDGYALCRQLKTDARTSHIPVILLTARASGESKVEGLETGADDYIIKPFDARELQVRIRNLIEQRQKMRERFRREVILEPKDIAITSMDEQFVQKTMDAIEQNLSDPEFSTEMFAKEVAMSRMQLNRKLRALTGHSTHEFIRIYRLQRAAQLLQHQAGTVAEICYDVGFNNLSHFAKVFKEHFGQSPSQFAASQDS